MITIMFWSIDENSSNVGMITQVGRFSPLSNTFGLVLRPSVVWYVLETIEIFDQLYLRYTLALGNNVLRRINYSGLTFLFFWFGKPVSASLPYFYIFLSPANRYNICKFRCSIITKVIFNCGIRVLSTALENRPITVVS